MDLTLNIDEYLRKFNIFNVSNELLTEYNNKYSLDEVTPVYNIPTYGDTSLIQLKSEKYYKTLLEDSYPTLAKILTVIVPKFTNYNRKQVFDGNGDLVNIDTPMEDYYKSWYFITDNAYHMKGNIRAVLYIFEYLGFRDYDYSYEYNQYNFSITTGLSMNTSDINLAIDLVTKLVSELLLVTETEVR